MAPTSYSFSVNFLADAVHVSRRRMLSALARNGGDPAAALVSFGEPSASASALAVGARALGPDGGSGRSGSSRSGSSRSSGSRVPLRLRATANRRAISRQPPAPGTQLREAARSGILTRGNTRPGTRGRQAVDAETYGSRQAAGARRGLGRGRASAGHEAPGGQARAMSTLLDSPPRWAVLDNLTRGEARRLARYDAMMSNLVQGDLSPRAFERRVGAWRPIRGERFLADPAAVLAILDQRRQAGDETFVYLGRRP